MSARPLPAAASDSRQQRIEAILNELRPQLETTVRQLVERAVDVPEAEEFGEGRHSPPKRVDGIPLGEEALVRKAAAVVFPSAEEWSASLEDVAVIEVGGDYYEDQQARLRFANEWIRQWDKRGR